MIKKMVVESDPFEANLRKVLNFGHTIGHAIESLSEGNLLHGECVALGMMYMVDKSIKKELEEVLKKFNLPTSINVNDDEIINLVRLDKKSSGTKVSIVYVKEIGSFEFRKIEINELKDYLK